MKRRPGWPQVTIALALIAALAIASPVFGISSSLKKAIRKEVSKQLASATGPPGAQGQQGVQGQQGAQGLQGPAGPPVAYAFINNTSTGADTVDEARSLNVTDANVTREATGILCFSNLPFSFDNVVGNSETGNRLLAMGGVVGDSGSCAGDEDVVVRQSVANTDATDNSAFYVLFN